MTERNPDEFVRVRYDNGSEVTLTRSVAEKAGYKILDDKRAEDNLGVALSDKPHLKLDPAVVNYDSQSSADLAKEAEARGLTVTGTGKDGAITKADNVAALQTYDAGRS